MLHVEGDRGILPVKLQKLHGTLVWRLNEEAYVHTRSNRLRSIPTGRERFGRMASESCCSFITRKSKTRDATRDDTSVEAETMARESCCAAAECWEVTRARL